MGLLSLGTPMPWEKSRDYNEHVRENGLEQLQNMFKAAYLRNNDKFLWGDEVEYTLIHFDKDQKQAKVAINEDHILTELNQGGKYYQLALDNNVNFHPEYGRFMLEATPLRPYDGESLNDYLYVEKNMNDRRVVANESLQKSNVKPITLTSYPLMGVGHFTVPDSIANGEASNSLFLPDEITNRHARFPTLTANIRKRRGEKVAINIPLFQDVNTSEIDDSIPIGRDLFPGDEEPHLGAAKPGHIYLDAMGFGMGNSCLQITVQAPNINKARYLYDSLANFAPIFLSLTSAAPIFKGYLSDQDVRWNVISGSVDDRTPYERNDKPLRQGTEYGGIRPEDYSKVQRIPKSRYDSIDSYLGDLQTNPLNGDKPTYTFFKSELNDTNPPINQKVFDQLVQNPRFDAPLSAHFAHLYIRDPIVIFEERIEQDNETETDHFENIQSTNWQTLRFKPPTQQALPENKSIPGWRVEFRPMEIQLTDFENAAFAVFIALLAQAILDNDFNFYIPLSKVEVNMKTAHLRNSTLVEKFHFKKDVRAETYETIELGINEIFNGGENFIGLIPIVRSHLLKNYGIELSSEGPHKKFYYYFELIKKRASGEIPTAASFIRKFVLNHETYQKDSKVNSLINYDLLDKLDRITNYQKDDVIEFFGEELGRYLLQEIDNDLTNSIH